MERGKERLVCRLPGGGGWEMQGAKDWQRKARRAGWAGGRASYPHGRPEAGRPWGGHAVPGNSSAPGPTSRTVLLAHQPPATALVAPRGPSGPSGHSSQGSCKCPAFPGTEPAPPGTPKVVRTRARSEPVWLPSMGLGVLLQPQPWGIGFPSQGSDCHIHGAGSQRLDI